MNAHINSGASTAYEAQLLSEMARAGIEVPPSSIVADGDIHRFPSRVGSKNPNGWYAVHAGDVITTWVFGDWSLGIEEKGRAQANGQLTEQQIREWRRRQEEIAAKVAAERSIFQNEVAAEAQRRWDGAKPATGHEYLQKKKIDPCGVRVAEGRLLVPMRDVDGKLWSLQEIYPSGDKLFPKNGRVSGCFFQVGDIKDVFCIGEGFATVATIHKATDYPVVAAFSSGNLETVAAALRKKHPAARIIVCGDDDWLTKVKGKPHNTGKIAAEKTAKAVGGILAMPCFSGTFRPKDATDFNDQAKIGIDDVAATIRLAVVAHEENEAETKKKKKKKKKKESTPTGTAVVVAVTLKDFYAYMPGHSYIFIPTRETWPPSSINARIPPVPVVDANGNVVIGKGGEPKCMPPNEWLDKNRPVEQMTWAPNHPELIRDRLIDHGGWIEREGATAFNLYRPPTIELGNPALAGPWTGHIEKVFGDQTARIILWLAHRVQRPHEKINHALVLGGDFGIGKDTLLEPIKRAVGPWNFIEVKPHQVMGRFNGFLRSTVLRISEVRDSGDVDRYKFFDHMKDYIAAPPDVLRVDEKNLKEYSIPNVTGVIITTNYDDSLYIPHNDRRHLVNWSDLKEKDFDEGYWQKLWRWYDVGGFGHVAAYLSEVNLSDFDPKAPPPKTDAFWRFVDSNRPAEDGELRDVLDDIGNPSAVTISRIATSAPAEFAVWLNDRKNRRNISHRMKNCGYVPVRNEFDKHDGQWRINGKRQTVYARENLSKQEQVEAATRLTGRQ